ncbi:MAG: rhomboid family intramembrane serine protease [Flavobacteriales bacterium]
MRLSFLERFRKGDPIMMLIGINLLVFVVIQLHLLRLYVTGTKASLPWGEDLMLAASSSMAVMAQRPWSLVTHLVAHIEPGHFLFNMIALYSMGKLITTMILPRRIWWVYLFGGVSGYLLFVVSFAESNVLSGGNNHFILGASAAVMAIVTAAAVIQPRRVVYLFNAIRLELMWLAILLAVLDLASIRQSFNSGGHIGHLGGALFGLVFGLLERAGIRGFGDIRKFLKHITQRNRLRVVRGHSRPKTDDEFNTERAARQKKIDEILDKIGRSGYESLSQSEKDFLFKHSQK